MNAFADEKVLLAFLLQYQTGRRIGEALPVRLPSFDFLNDEVELRISKKSKPTYRRFKLPHEYMLRLKVFVLEHREDIEYNKGCVFFGEKGRPGHMSYEKMRKEFANARHAIRLDLTYHKDAAGARRYAHVTHCLRSTAAERVYQLRKDPLEIMHFLDHDSLLATAPYIRQFQKNEHKDEYAAELGRIMLNLQKPPADHIGVSRTQELPEGDGT
jgi:integrase